MEDSVEEDVAVASTRASSARCHAKPKGAGARHEGGWGEAFESSQRGVVHDQEERANRREDGQERLRLALAEPDDTHQQTYQDLKERQR